MRDANVTNFNKLYCIQENCLRNSLVRSNQNLLSHLYVGGVGVLFDTTGKR